MEWFLRAYRFLLLVFAFLFGLAVSFVIGGGVAECLNMPEQPDYRNVLDKITQDMDIQQLQHLLNEHFYCSMEMNYGIGDFPNSIWVAPRQDVRAWNYCLIAKSYGDSWSHEYIFYFGGDGKLLGIAASFPRRELEPRAGRPKRPASVLDAPPREACPPWTEIAWDPVHIGRSGRPRRAGCSFPGTANHC